MPKIHRDTLEEQGSCSRKTAGYRLVARRADVGEPNMHSHGFLLGCMIDHDSKDDRCSAQERLEFANSNYCRVRYGQVVRIPSHTNALRLASVATLFVVLPTSQTRAPQVPDLRVVRAHRKSCLFATGVGSRHDRNGVRNII